MCETVSLNEHWPWLDVIRSKAYRIDTYRELGNRLNKYRELCNLTSHCAKPTGVLLVSQSNFGSSALWSQQFFFACALICTRFNICAIIQYMHYAFCQCSQLIRRVLHLDPFVLIIIIAISKGLCCESFNFDSTKRRPAIMFDSSWNSFLETLTISSTSSKKMFLFPTVVQVTVASSLLHS